VAIVYYARSKQVVEDGQKLTGAAKENGAGGIEWFWLMFRKLDVRRGYGGEEIQNNGHPHKTPQINTARHPGY